MKIKRIDWRDLDAAMRRLAEMPEDADVTYTGGKNEEGTGVINGAVVTTEVPNGWEVQSNHKETVLYRPALDGDGQPKVNEDGDRLARVVIRNIENGPPFPYIIHTEGNPNIEGEVAGPTIDDAAMAVDAVLRSLEPATIWRPAEVAEASL